ncbi:MAG: beta-galactosidase [Candidatus Obscuribacterales bacterium]|nr:beta-galactosidase [Candidatus Obscuribacterales bacterium]
MNLTLFIPRVLIERAKSAGCQCFKERGEANLLALLLMFTVAFTLSILCASAAPGNAKDESQKLTDSEVLHVDKFGQNASTDWTGKVHSEKDLTEIDVSEKLDLQNNIACSQWDDFGALKTGPNLDASGFFAVKEVYGRWWFVSPAGKPFYSIALDCVVPGSLSPLRKSGEEKEEQANETAAKTTKKKESAILAKYDWIPKPDGDFAAARNKDSVSFYVANLQRKWGAEWRKNFEKRVFERMRSWNFNSLGNWSDDVLQSKNFPYFSMGPSTWELKINYIDGDIPDVYDPRFEEEAVRVCAKDLSKSKTDKWLVGYFLDNEMPWWNIPYDVLALDSKEPCKSAWLSKLRAKYATIEKLNKSWGTKANNFGDLRWVGDKATSAAKRDMAELLRDFANRFYSGWYKAMKHADPNHLVLGSRIPYPMDEVVDACARNTDVLSFNHYAIDLPKKFDEYYRKYRKPILIGEYDFDSFDAGLKQAFVKVKDQKQRAIGYTYYTEQAAAKPYMIGTHYFQYLDEPLTGRGDGESSFNGFVSVADRPYPDLVQAARTTNCRIYEIHSGKLRPSTEKPI